MNILLGSRPFYPSIGGIETVVDMLAREFVRCGHIVKVITETEGDEYAADGTVFPFQVIRQPSFFEIINLARWCDVYLQNGISLRTAWPLLVVKRPWVISHHGWIRSMDGSVSGMGGKTSSWKVQVKRLFSCFATSVCVSSAVAQHLSCPSIVIHNPYRVNLFRTIPNILRTKDFVYLGRLVSEKGVNTLLHSLAQLKNHGLFPKLTVIGDGPERSKLQQMAVDLEIEHQVDFVGVKVEEELVNLLNEHRIMVVPSLYNEPFGVVALEGIACGCVVVGSEGGGLKEAIGPCGVTFPNGDVLSLTQILIDFLSSEEKLAVYRQDAQTHLQLHSPNKVAEAYLRILHQVMQ